MKKVDSHLGCVNYGDYLCPAWKFLMLFRCVKLHGSENSSPAVLIIQGTACHAKGSLHFFFICPSR